MKSCRLCKEDYQEVKDRLTMSQVAEYYGCRIQKSGLCLCPFHQDQRPSMKIYPNNKGFYCWSCGKGGDVIKFVSLLFNLTNQKSCIKLIENFALPIRLENLSYREKRERQKKQNHYNELQKFKREAYSILQGYWMLLCSASRNFADPHFEEALQELSIVEYRLSCLEKHPEEYYADRKAVNTLGEIQRRIIGWYDNAYYS